MARAAAPRCPHERAAGGIHAIVERLAPEHIHAAFDADLRARLEGNGRLDVETPPGARALVGAAHVGTVAHVDMSGRAADLAVERLFEWPSPTLTIEFQGGEPLLHFGRLRAITERIQARNLREGRELKFVVASTLHD